MKLHEVEACHGHFVTSNFLLKQKANNSDGKQKMSTSQESCDLFVGHVHSMMKWTVTESNCLERGFENYCDAICTETLNSWKDAAKCNEKIKIS